jgi:hypothetical protein
MCNCAVLPLLPALGAAAAGSPGCRCKRARAGKSSDNSSAATLRRTAAAVRLFRPSNYLPAAAIPALGKIIILLQFAALESRDHQRDIATIARPAGPRAQQLL